MNHPSPPPVLGSVGIMLSPGQQALTQSGNLTSPFPKFNLSSKSSASRSLRRINAWLISNASQEALRRSNLTAWAIFSQESPKDTPQASKDSMEAFLFDPHFPHA
jgi:hypothetical protein